eukprot:COSAG02_NODE_35669_length_465_cov_0.814208_2_plen_72_part_01
MTSLPPLHMLLGGGWLLGPLLAMVLPVPTALAQQTCAEQCQSRAQQCETVCTQARAQLDLDNMHEETLDRTL